MEHSNAQLVAMDKKLHSIEKQMDDWKQKYDDLSTELEATQHDSRSISTELFKIKTLNEEYEESVRTERVANIPYLH